MEKDSKICPFSSNKQGSEDMVTEYSYPIIFEECIIVNRLEYSNLWDIYLDYQEEQQYYKLPFLIAFLLQAMHTDRAIVQEAKFERERGNK